MGYGRLYPVTTLGKAIAMLTGILGTFYMAMPLSIVGNEFYTVFQKMKEVKQKPIKDKLKRAKKYAMLLRSLNKTGFSKLNTASSRSINKPRNATLEKYKSDLEDFCNIAVLHSVETVNPGSIAEVQVCDHGSCKGIQIVLLNSDHRIINSLNATQLRLASRKSSNTLRKTMQKQVTRSRLGSSNVA